MRAGPGQEYPLVASCENTHRGVHPRQDNELFKELDLYKPNTRQFIALLLVLICTALAASVAPAQDATELPNATPAPGPQATGGAGAADQVEAWIKENIGEVAQPESVPTEAQAGAAPATTPAIQSLAQPSAQPGGSLDWASGALTFTTEEIVPADSISPQRHRAMGLRRATLRARKALLGAVENLSLDGRRKVLNTLSQVEIRAVRAHLQNSRVQQREEMAEDGSMHLFVSSLASLRGDMANLLMPGSEPFLGGVPDTIELTIGQVPVPIRDPEQASYRTSMAELGGFTGLVVDARGLEARPALLPVVADPSGLTAYGSFQVAREDAARKGVVIYTRNPEGNLLRSRAGKSPLTVRALAVSGANKADLVISYEDAILVRTLFKKQDVKNHCRAVIILD